MKNVYYENFLKYSNYVNNKTFNSYTELVEGVSKLNISKEENLKDRKAMVMFGFSGNGKTTWINSFCKSNPDYVILSMDSIVKEISNKLGR